VARALGASRISPRDAKEFEDFALALDLVPNLARWARSEKDGVLEVIRAKSAPSERTYLRVLASQPRLRRTLIGLGSR
jgi:hypothetical protein